MSNIKHLIVTVVIAIGLIAFVIGVPSPQVMTISGIFGPYDVPYPTVGYFGGCSDSTDTSTCKDFTMDFYHCSRGDSTDAYSYTQLFTEILALPSSYGSLDQNLCQRAMACEAFGLLAILFSFIATLTAIFRNRAHKHAAAATSFVASLFAIVALGVFFGGKSELLNAVASDSTLSEAVSNGDAKLGYSAAFQIIGIVFSFFGGVFAAVFAKKEITETPLLG